MKFVYASGWIHGQLVCRPNYGSRRLSSRSIRGTGMHTRSWALGTVNPGRSIISTTLTILPPLGSTTFQSKHCIVAASTVCSCCRAKDIPGQPLRPVPKDSNWKCCPLTSIKPTGSSFSARKNRSGQKSNGFSQYFGFLPIDQMLTISIV